MSSSFSSVHIIPGPLMLKKGFPHAARLHDLPDDDDDDDNNLPSSSLQDNHQRNNNDNEEDEEDDVQPQYINSSSMPSNPGGFYDDGLTDAQRDLERKHRQGVKRKGGEEKTHKERVEEFNAKLAKLTDINEM